MKPRFLPMATLVAAGLLMLGGCEDKHEPTKPTVIILDSPTLAPAR